MLDYWEMRDLFQQGVWQGLVLLWHALWVNALTYWWFGPLVLAILITAGRRKLVRLVRWIGGTFVRGQSGPI
ncbi:hypothetical protein [Microbacterium sp. CJ77]|uniref:hypothetical protein n=1 Tax=Microbacterium sp. CJ77 TaxID=2079201 RepID=UPI000CD98648|nr:hypothetical protein [Microbacterium sp. CJ77]